MAKTDEYIEEAYRELEKMSADEQTKLEYEARERAIRDYNSQMNSALKRGVQRGIQQGIQLGIHQERFALIRQMLAKGMQPGEIADLAGFSMEEIEEAKQEPKIR